MGIYLVETYRPPYPQKDSMVRAQKLDADPYEEATKFKDTLSADLTSAYIVYNASNQNEAIASVIEHYSGVSNFTGKRSRIKIRRWC